MTQDSSGGEDRKREIKDKPTVPVLYYLNLVLSTLTTQSFNVLRLTSLVVGFNSPSLSHSSTIVNLVLSLAFFTVRP